MHNELADYANNNVCTSEEQMTRFLTGHPQFKVTAATCTYGEGATGSRRLKSAMANHVNLNLKPACSLNANDIMFARGVTAINEMYAWCLADEGDGILLSKPIYAAFENDLTTKAR